MQSINTNAPVTCSKTISISAPAEKVWNVLTNINAWATWQTDISSPSISGATIVGNVFTWKTGGANITSTLHTVNPTKEFGWMGKTFGMFAIHNWTLNEVARITTVSVTESMEGFLAKLFKTSFNKNLEKGMQNWLQLLKQECEK